MIQIKLESLDYRYILITEYKALKLTEEELVVLLLIDSLKEETPSLITGEALSVKMNLKSDEIDQILIKLIDKKFLSYETVNNVLVTSMKLTYKKIINLITSKVTEEEDPFDLKNKEDSLQTICSKLEENLKRTLTPLELTLVTTWLEDGVDLDVINNSIDECSLKEKKITVKKVDKLIIKNLQQNDKSHEGFTTVDEQSKIDIKKAMDIANYDWMNDD